MLPLKSLLDQARGSMGTEGPKIAVSGYEGVVSFIEVAGRIQTAAKARFESRDLTLQERVAGIRIVERMKVIYCEMMGLEELPEPIQMATDDVLCKFRAIPEAEYLRLFGGETTGEGIFEDYRHSTGMIMEFRGDGTMNKVILAKTVAIIAAFERQNSMDCGLQARISLIS